MPCLRVLVLVSLLAGYPESFAAIVLQSAWVSSESRASAFSLVTNPRTELDVDSLRGTIGPLFATAARADRNLTFAQASSQIQVSFEQAASTYHLQQSAFVNRSISPQIGDNATASASQKLWVDFLVQGETAKRPQTIQVDGKSPGSFLITTQSGVFVGGDLAPGAYRLSMGREIAATGNGSQLNSTITDLKFLSVLETAPGFSQADPILPTTTEPGGIGSRFRFVGSRTGGWYDPIGADGYLFQAEGSMTFTDILSLPTGFDSPFRVEVDGQSIGGFDGGSSVNFVSLLGHGVAAFTITGISPSVDPDNPLAFPIQLAFSENGGSFTMTPIAAVPEPSIAFMLLCGMGIVGMGRLKRARSSRSQL